MDLGWLFILFLLLSFVQEFSGRTDMGIFFILPIVALIQYFSPT